MFAPPQKDFLAGYPLDSLPAVPLNVRPVGDLSLLLGAGLPMKGLLMSIL